MLSTRQRVLIGIIAAALTAGVYAESHLMRMADIHHDMIVFTYEGDLWFTSTTGGLARRLTNDPGSEGRAKFSPDGKSLAFTAQYDGNSDVYVMEATGGVPRRLTFHPGSDRVLGWWPDGRSVLFRARRAYPSRGEEVYRISVDGGMPERLPVDRAGLTAVSPDGKKIAYNRGSRESRTWKRHRGGTAQDIWMGSLEAMDYEKIIDTDWTDNYPMWQGDAIYFLSDRTWGTLNLYRYDMTSGNTTALTTYQDYDVKYPSIGPGAIVYQYAESLHVLDLQSLRTRKIAVEIPSDLIRMRPEFVTPSPSSGSFGLSPTGKRAFIEARGEIINYAVEDGEPFVVTGNTSASREKNAAWSPDGRWIAFISDHTGEEEVWLVDQKGEQPWKQVTKNGLGFRMPLVWSPDSKYLMFSDKFMRLYLVDVEGEAAHFIAQCEHDDAWERWGIQDYVFSPDSKWVAYTKMEATMYESIFLYSIETQETTRLTCGLTNDWSPSFDPDGKYLYFLSNRSLHPTMGAVDQNHIFLDVCRPFIMLLQADAEHPFATKEVLEDVQEDEDEEEENSDETSEDEEDADDDALQIDLDGIQRRIVVADGVSPGNYFRLEAVAGGFLYLSKPDTEFIKYQNVNDHTGGALDLYQYKVEDAEASKKISGITNYHLSADGEKLIYRAGSRYGVVDVGDKADVGDGKIDLGDARLRVTRGEEFLQIFNEAWRIQRDWFYDPDMHGLDWAAIGEKYRRYVPFCGNRSDLNYLIGEMIAELNIGHTYVWGGDVHYGGKSVRTGLLGAELGIEGDAPYYQIKHIVPNQVLVPGERSPLDEPGCPIEVGHYLIAIDGMEVTTADNVYDFLQNKANRVVTLKYNTEPTAEGAETYRIKTLGSEWGIRYREWVEGCRMHVDETTAGRVGYVHLPDMGQNGLREFARYFYPQYHKHAMIIDARYNGGGFTADMILDRLEREIWSVSQPREGNGWRDPERVFVGPWVVLINEDTGSNGEMFAEAIKIKKMAPVIGMRTWGGSIGIEPHQPLIDGGTVTPPQFGLYGLDRTWLIEGIGVVPDIEVQNMPGDVMRGKDAQLDAGIENVLQRLKEDGPFELPPPPAYPDKSRPHGS